MDVQERRRGRHAAPEEPGAASWLCWPLEDAWPTTVTTPAEEEREPQE